MGSLIEPVKWYFIVKLFCNRSDGRTVYVRLDYARKIKKEKMS